MQNQHIKSMYYSIAGFKKENKKIDKRAQTLKRDTFSGKINKSFTIYNIQLTSYVDIHLLF